MIGETGLLPPDKLEQVRAGRRRLILPGADRRGLRERARRRPHARRAVPPAARRPRGRGRRRRGVEVDRSAGARARLRDPVRRRRRAPQGRDHRPAERAGRSTSCGSRRARQIEFYVAAEERRAHRAAPPLARGGGAERRVRRRGGAVEEDEEDEDDLEADDGISDAPLVRLVNSIIFQAAEEGASDIHVEPQENELIVRFRIDGVLHVAQRIPKRLDRRRDHAPEGAREAGHRRAAQAAGRPDHADGGRGRAACSTSAWRRCRRSRARR